MRPSFLLGIAIGRALTPARAALLPRCAPLPHGELSERVPTANSLPYRPNEASIVKVKNRQRRSSQQAAASRRTSVTRRRRTSEHPESHSADALEIQRP